MAKQDKSPGISVNIYFHSNKSPHMHLINEHEKWLSEVKPNFDIEDYALIKFLKTWRRSKGLYKIKTQVLEVLAFKSGKASLCEKVNLSKLLLGAASV
jgi:hypothetical protein